MFQQIHCYTSGEFLDFILAINNHCYASPQYPCGTTCCDVPGTGPYSCCGQQGNQCCNGVCCNGNCCAGECCIKIVPDPESESGETWSFDCCGFPDEACCGDECRPLSYPSCAGDIECPTFSDSGNCIWWKGILCAADTCYREVYPISTMGCHNLSVPAPRCTKCKTREQDFLGTMCVQFCKGIPAYECYCSSREGGSGTGYTLPYCYHE